MHIKYERVNILHVFPFTWNQNKHYPKHMSQMKAWRIDNEGNRSQSSLLKCPHHVLLVDDRTLPLHPLSWKGLTIKVLYTDLLNVHAIQLPVVNLNLWLIFRIWSEKQIPSTCICNKAKFWKSDLWNNYCNAYQMTSYKFFHMVHSYFFNIRPT